MTKTLQLSKTLKSNKSLSYRYLAQIAMSVPKRVKFNSIQYDGKKSTYFKVQQLQIKIF